AAIAALKKQRPEDAELSAAATAAEGVKAALDAANELESQDLDYAKYALAARKDTRAQRELVEKRRLEVAIELAREDIGRTLTELTAALKRIQARDVTEDDFAHARATADEGTRALGRAQP